MLITFNFVSAHQISPHFFLVQQSRGSPKVLEHGDEVIESLSAPERMRRDSKASGGKGQPWMCGSQQVCGPREEA